MIKEAFSVGDRPDIDVRIPSGRIEVKPGEPGTVTVEIETTDPSIKVEQRGDQIQVSSDKNTGFSTAWRGSTYVVVFTPDGSNLDIGTASANIESSARLQDVNIKTASGDITLDDAESINIKTASGDARIRSAQSDVKVSTASGDVRIGDVEGKVNFSSASGDLAIESCRGSVNASTASGDVNVGWLSGRRINLKSMSGAADIGIPRARNWTSTPLC